MQKATNMSIDCDVSRDQDETNLRKLSSKIFGSTERPLGRRRRELGINSGDENENNSSDEDCSRNSIGDYQFNNHGLGTAEDQVGEACATDSDASTLSEYSYSSSSSSTGSVVTSTENETRRNKKYIKEQARILTRKIRQKERSMLHRSLCTTNNQYDTDESMENKNNNISGVLPSSNAMMGGSSSYYFTALNDVDDVDRSRSIFDEESVSSNCSQVQHESDDSKSDVEHSQTTCDYAVEEYSADSVDIEYIEEYSMDIDESKMERSRKRNKIWWTSMRKWKGNQGKEQEYEQEQGNVPNKLRLSSSAEEELADQKKQPAKKQGSKKIRIFLIAIVPLIIIGMAGLGAFLGVTWDYDTTKSTSSRSSSGIDVGSEAPKLRFSPPSDDNTNFKDNGQSSSSSSSSSSSTGGLSLDEDLGNNSGENEELSSPAGGTSPDDEPAPPVDEDLLQKHMEAYEEWKLNNGITDDDHYVSVDVEFEVDENMDETIYFKMSSSSDE